MAESRLSGAKAANQTRTARRQLTAEQLRARTIYQIFDDARRSGKAGAVSMAIQVSALMWMRTIMNTQYRYGGGIRETARRLYTEGGMSRFYRGYPVALVQGPISRFGDTFSNTLFLALMEKNQQTRELPVFMKTLGASLTAGCFRVLLVPIDTLKTVLQVEGGRGAALLRAKYRAGGPFVLYHGAMATWAATLVGHYPWFLTYNTLNKWLPRGQTQFQSLSRQATIGFICSVFSDTCSNSLRVIKTAKQTSGRVVGYADVAREIIAKEGVKGLFGRGLKMRVLTNGCQGLLFSVLWKHFESVFSDKSANI